ncbi:MAG: hypothetical protein ACFFBP_22665 [Promethearchaeota archaeon]
MEIRKYQIECKTGSYSHLNLNRNYSLVQVIYNRDVEEDSITLDHIYDRGIKLAQRVNPAAASNSIHRRERERLHNDGVSGFLAEYSWFYFLNNLYRDDFVKFTDFNDATNQIDLLITKNSKRIEVRSSNVRNGVKFGLCNREHQFHIVGPYSNIVKPGEVGKDFYVMVLYPVLKRNWFSDFFNSKIVRVDLTCGATWEMMNNDEIYEWSSLESKDQRSQKKSTYRAIPFGRSLDTAEITRLMNED